MPHVLRTWRSRKISTAVGVSVFVLVLVSGCTGRGAPSIVPPTTDLLSEQSTPSPPATVSSQSATCADGRLTIGDLAKLDGVWEQGLAEETRVAEAWRADVKLTSFRVGCALLESDFRWQTTFYSPSAQAFFSTDTGVVQPAEFDPSEIPELAMDNLSFGRLRRSLTKAGYSDTSELNPATGVDMRMNTAVTPFGPPDAPKDVPLFHVAVIYRGEIRDLFINVADGTIYRYSF